MAIGQIMQTAHIPLIFVAIIMAILSVMIQHIKMPVGMLTLTKPLGELTTKLMPIGISFQRVKIFMALSSIIPLIKS